jgi:membrane-associated protease RseP (regulator of RpoE activity)
MAEDAHTPKRPVNEAHRRGRKRIGKKKFATHVSMRVSTPVVMANLIVSSESAAVPAGHARICNLLPIIGMIGTSTLSPTPLEKRDVRSQNLRFPGHGE